MTISREKCLEMVQEVGGERRIYEKSPGQDHILLLDTDLEALINRAYAEGQKDMRERAAKEIDFIAEFRPEVLATGIAEAVRKLEIE